jgi:hypothetical protein
VTKHELLQLVPEEAAENILYKRDAYLMQKREIEERNKKD